MREIFKGLFGNERLKEHLGGAIACGAASHAYIFEGPAGTGKRTLAKLAAAALSCENRSDPSYPLPCGVCPVCKRILKGISSDVFTVSKEDKATIGVGRIREIRENLYVTPNDSDRKIYVIEEADKMTTQAQNALLISLEEPPRFVTFFLLTENASKLLDTVRSRAVTLRMEVFGEDGIKKYLSSLPEAERAAKRSPDKYDAAVRLSHGSPGVARDILLGAGKKDREAEERADRFAQMLIAGDVSSALSFAGREIAGGIEKTAAFLTAVAGSVRNMMAAKAAPAFRDGGDNGGLTAVTSGRRIMFVYDRVTEALSAVSSNASPKLTVYDLIFDCKK